MNWNKKIGVFSCFIFLCLAAGCGYSSRPLLGMGFRTIAIRNLENKTYEHDLDILATGALRDEFIFDGTLRVVEETRADLLLTGALIGYTFDPLSYDTDDSAESYLLQIKTQLSLKNLKTDEFIWENKVIDGNARYILTGSLAETEVQARARALDDLVEEILRQTIDLW